MESLEKEDTKPVKYGKRTRKGNDMKQTKKSRLWLAAVVF